MNIPRIQKGPFKGGQDATRPWWGFWEADTSVPYLAMPCGKHCIARLGLHKIAEDGNVSPSAMCPNHPNGFHEFIKLEGWETKDGTP